MTDVFQTNIKKMHKALKGHGENAGSLRTALKGNEK
jgi:hypothetical protein